MLHVVGDILGDGNIDATGTVTAAGFVTSSSREVKEEIASLSRDEAFSTFQRLRPVTFRYKPRSPIWSNRISAHEAHVPHTSAQSVV